MAPVKPVILTVDDDVPVLRAIERDLRARYGKEHRVVAASSGAEALEAVRQLTLRGSVISLFVIDQRMPSMTGIEFLSQAIELPTMAPPTMTMSARSEDSTRGC